jgi:excisionase family DNA binding protein
MGMKLERVRDVMTPEQAADYLQVNRETIYRYIREGRLVASRLGRAYRIPKLNLDALLWATRTRRDIQLREFSDAEIAAFQEADRLTGRAREITDQIDRLSKQPINPAG